MHASHLRRIETELAAVMPAPLTRYLFPLAPVVDLPLSSAELAAMAAPSKRCKVMATFNVVISELTATELAEVATALELYLAGVILERVTIGLVFA